MEVLVVLVMILVKICLKKLKFHLNQRCAK